MPGRRLLTFPFSLCSLSLTLFSSLLWGSAAWEHLQFVFALLTLDPQTSAFILWLAPMGTWQLECCDATVDPRP